MTRKLEDLFDLAEVSIDDAEDTNTDIIEPTQEHLQELTTALDKIDAALPTVRNINASDTEMDYLAQLATTNFEELMSLGMNVEPRHGAEIFSTASTLLGHAIQAKNNKMTNKLKIIQLQIQKARLDMQRQKAEVDGPVEGEVNELDRNALLAQIISMNKNQDSDK